MNCSVQTKRVNDVLSTKNGHTKASSTFQLLIYDDLIYFFFYLQTIIFCECIRFGSLLYCKYHPKSNVSVNLRLIKDIFPVKKSIERFDWG